MEEKIRNLIEGEVLKLGVSIDSVEYVKEGQNYFLRIVIDRDEPIDIDKCVEVLRAGGIILYPTDTIWGIGCDATNEEAVAKVYALKRSEDKRSECFRAEEALTCAM